MTSAASWINVCHGGRSVSRVYQQITVIACKLMLIDRRREIFTVVNFRILRVRSTSALDPSRVDHLKSYLVSVAPIDCRSIVVAMMLEVRHVLKGLLTFCSVCFKH